MSNSDFQPIEKITAAFDFKNEIVYFGGDTTDIKLNNPNQVKNNIQLLSNIIYDNCYSRCCFSFQHEQTSTKTNSENKQSAFLEKLKSSNNTIDAFDSGWLAEDVNETNTILASKKEYLLIANAGNYLNKSRNFSEPVTGDKIIIQLHRDSFRTGNHFYFISGQQQHDWWNSGSARFYWNLKPEGASILIELLTKEFNRFGIPFGFKCIVDPDSYNRCDNTVLYLANCYLSIGLKFLKEIYHSVSEFLDDEVPLFTLKLSKGFSFAENPPWNGVSFGQSRSHIIARGLIKAWNSNVPENNISEIVKQTIVENDLNPEKFYLNPRSSFEYDFSVFDF